MKTAVSPAGEIIKANWDAPDSACCPQCGNPVTLRRRRSMSGEVTYFWRHRKGFANSCRHIVSPVSRRMPNWKNSQDERS